MIDPKNYEIGDKVFVKAGSKSLKFTPIYDSGNEVHMEMSCIVFEKGFKGEIVEVVHRKHFVTSEIAINVRDLKSGNVYLFTKHIKEVYIKKI